MPPWCLCTDELGDLTLALDEMAKEEVKKLSGKDECKHTMSPLTRLTLTHRASSPHATVVLVHR